MLKFLTFITALIAVIPQPAIASPEPTISGRWSADKASVCLTLLEHVFEWARNENPSQPLAVGLWTGESACPKTSRLTDYVLANSDVISFHDYLALHQTIERVDTFKPFGRPIICTGYLARAGGSYFESHLPYFKGNKIGAYNWGSLAGKIQTQYPWSFRQEEFTAEPVVWHHDILRPDGTPHQESEVNLIKAITCAADPLQQRNAP